MAIDPNSNYDQIVLKRITNLEERVRDLTIAHQRFITLTQLNELLTIISNDLAVIKSNISSLEQRIGFLEDNPEDL
jgi:hypothetical protein